MFDTSLFAGLQVDSDSILIWAQQHGLDEAARMCAYKISHSDWGTAGGRIISWQNRNQSPKTIEEYLETLKITDSQVILEAEEKAPECIRELIKEVVHKHPIHQFGLKYLEFYQKNALALNDALKHERDYQLDFFGVKTLEKGFFLKDEKGKVIETPQFLFLRSAVQDHPDSLEDVIQQYNDMSLGLYSVASPHLANACLQKNQLASCNLMVIPDNLEGIYKMLFNSAMISKHKGGIGFDVSSIRHSSINRGGSSAGIVPMLKNYNEQFVMLIKVLHVRGPLLYFYNPGILMFGSSSILRRIPAKKNFVLVILLMLSG